MERNGTERNGTERNGTERNGTERNGTVEKAAIQLYAVTAVRGALQQPQTNRDETSHTSGRRSEVQSNFSPRTPKHQGRAGETGYQRARRINKLANPAKSAQLPSPVQIRAAPPNFTSVKPNDSPRGRLRRAFAIPRPTRSRSGAPCSTQLSRRAVAMDGVLPVPTSSAGWRDTVPRPRRRTPPTASRSRGPGDDPTAAPAWPAW